MATVRLCNLPVVRLKIQFSSKFTAWMTPELLLTRLERTKAEWTSGVEAEARMSSAAASCPSHFIHSRVCLVCVHCVFCPQYLCVHLHLSVRKSRGLLMFLRWSRNAKKKKKNFAFHFFFVPVWFCDLFPPSLPSRSHPLHQWRERKHPPSGGHVIWADGQLQLGGGLQSPDHHPPPHDVRQRGRRLFHEKQPNQPKTATEQTLQDCQLKRSGKIALSGRQA